MSFEITLEIILNIIQIFILLGIIIVAARSISKDRTGLVGALFTFAMVSLVLMDIYWVAYDVLRPDTRMPFTGDEIAGSATILLLAAALYSMLPKERKQSFKAVLLTFLFVTANIILWIAWSGEWGQDIVFGLPYYYYMYILLIGNKHFEVFDKTESRLAVIICTVIIMLHFSVLATTGSLNKALDAAAYTVMIVSVLLYFIKNVLVMKENKPAKAVFASFGLYFYTVMILYMSGGIFYDLATVFYTLSLPFMLITVKKEITRSDLC